MSENCSNEQPVGTGVMLYRGDGGSPEQFHLVGELTGFGTPGFKVRLKELQRRIQEGKKLTSEDFWALTGDPVSDRVARGAENARKTLDLRRSAEQEGSREQHALVSRQIVEALRTLQVLASPPPKELIELVAYQLQVLGKPRNSVRDTQKWGESSSPAGREP